MRIDSRFPRLAAAVALALSLGGSLHAQTSSTCYGTTANGRLEDGRKLPASGSNFQSYSTIGRLLGRTWVHSTVHSIVVDAYAALAESSPETVFVYGETGKRTGGEFKPHKTHRNGLSVDFMVPVIDDRGRSVPLPTSAFNRWGYDLEFDTAGRLDEFVIDFEAIAEHIYQLREAALRHGVDLSRVIIDPEFQPLLRATRRWEYLEQNVRFSERRSWVRHDEHYHVDFAVPCRSN